MQPDTSVLLIRISPDYFQYITIQNGTTPTLPYPIYLRANNDKIYNGTWNLGITLTNCDTGAKLDGATVKLTTGMNGWCTQGCLPNNPQSNGYYFFSNVTASLVAQVTMSKAYFTSKTDTYQLIYPTNYTTHKQYCLAPLGSTITPTQTIYRKRIGGCYDRTYRDRCIPNSY